MGMVAGAGGKLGVGARSRGWRNLVGGRGGTWTEEGGRETKVVEGGTGSSLAWPSGRASGEWPISGALGATWRWTKRKMSLVNRFLMIQ